MKTRLTIFQKHDKISSYVKVVVKVWRVVLIMGVLSRWKLQRTIKGLFVRSNETVYIVRAFVMNCTVFISFFVID